MKKKRNGRIFLYVLAVLVLLLGSFALWQRENIAAFMEGRKQPSGEIEKRIDDTRERIVEAVGDIPVRDLSEEETNSLCSGGMSEKELHDRLTEGEAQTAYQKELADLIADIYILRAQYIAALDGMAEQARQEYAGFSEREKTKAKLAKWVAGYVSEATRMENECDDRMDGIVAAMSSLIRENDGDLQLVDEVINGYAEEKSLRKSMYVSKIRERGLL